MALELPTIIILSVLPVSELRGAIPYGMTASSIPAPAVFAMAVLSNMLVIPIVFFFLDFIHHRLVHISIYTKLFNKFVERTRKKAHHYTEKYGWIGLSLFVAIPLPITGAYTGTLAAWLLGVERKRAMLALSIGVLIAGIVVSTVVLTGLEAGIFVNEKLIN